jgi:prepilin-type N-terminal cleavage/methylation domain-containing protein
MISRMVMTAKPRGFTILELLVVVGILAIVGGSVITFYGGGNAGIRGDTLSTVANQQMQALRNALLAYRTDVGALPDTSESPVNINFLIKPQGAKNWSPDYKTGWRGPYLSTQNIAYVDVGDMWQADGDHGPHFVKDGQKRYQMALADPYESGAVQPISVSSDGDSELNSAAKQRLNAKCTENITSNNACVLDWHTAPGVAPDEESSASNIEKNGRPYALFDLDTLQEARIMGFGADGIFNSADLVEDYRDQAGLEPEDTFECRDLADFLRQSANNDDLILCLL